MRCAQRGFSLVETMVAVGISALLLVAGGAFLLGMRPGTLMQATHDFDAALSSARAFAVSNGNGATLVFAPRTGATTAGGFELRVYSGRPTGAGAVSRTTSMRLVTGVDVREKTLGKVPFSIFIGASGHVSGMAGYPGVDAAGSAAFTPIATEPPCPSGGFVLTFSGPQGASATRSLACAARAIATGGLPNASPTPNPPIVTPTALVYHWPGDAEQEFVATEWGYTHWFVTGNGFACGDGVATFPNVLPSPYSAAISLAEAQADPKRPAGVPYSFPNSGGGSTNDAPARFPLDPATEGLCNASVADDYGQQAQASVQVMGWLTAWYGGRSYTHLSSPVLSIPASALARKGASVTLALAKTFDAEALQPQVALDPVCSQYLSASVSSGSTPASPSKSPATATVTLTVIAVPSATVSCSGTIFDQYNGSQQGEDVAFNAALQQEGALQTWPPAEQVALAGGNVGTTADGSQPCLARAFDWTGTDFGAPIGNASLYDAQSAVIVQTDSSGCMLDPTGKPLPGGAVATQKGFTSGAFTYTPGSCTPYVNSASAWAPNASGMGPGGEYLAVGGTAVTKQYCSFLVYGDPASSSASSTVVVKVACIDSSGLVPVDSSCKLTLPPDSDTGDCTGGVSQGGGGHETIISYFASFSDAPTMPQPVTQDAGVGTITNGSGVAVFSRTGPGAVTVYTIKIKTDITPSPISGCDSKITVSVLQNYTYE